MKGKVINIFLFCGGISMFLSVIKTLAKNTGVFAQCLPIYRINALDFWVYNNNFDFLFIMKILKEHIDIALIT